MLRTMSMTRDQGEEKDPKTGNQNTLTINKGVELMLRRDKTSEPKTRGFRLAHALTLLKRNFYFNIEFTWGRVEEN